MMYLPNRSLYNIEPSSNQKAMTTAEKIMIHMENISNTVKTNREISAALTVQLEQDSRWIKAQQKQVSSLAKQAKLKNL